MISEKVSLRFRIKYSSEIASKVHSIGSLIRETDIATMDSRVLKRLAPSVRHDPSVLKHVYYGGHLYPGTEFMVGFLEGIENGMDELSFYDN